MLKTCIYCGIVPENHVCPYKKNKRDSVAGKIRKTSKWQKKSLAIRERDNYLCRICLLERYNTLCKYNFNNLSVHHIVPIEKDISRAYDDNNLITLCYYHHKLAENNDISKEELLKIVREDIRISPPDVVKLNL